nr:hypothetical protein [Bacillus sp. FJAT-42376]
MSKENAAYSAAEEQGKVLLQKTAAYQTAVNSGSISKVNGLYNGLNGELKSAEALIGKVSGKSIRDALGQKYVNPAKKTIERTIYEVSQYRLMNSIKPSGDNLSKSEAQLRVLDRLQTRAAQIKKDGGYSALPAGITRSLESQEATLYGMIVQVRTADYNKAILNSSMTSIDRLYDRFTSSITSAEKEIGEVYGSANRSSILNVYVKPAKIARERTIYQISMHRQMNKIDALLKSGSSAKAKQELQKLERLQSRSIEIQKELGYPQLKTLDASLSKRYRELQEKLV